MAAAETIQSWRLFVAIAVPDAVKRRIQNLTRDLQDLLSPGAARWTPPDQLHLTLKFLGAVDTTAVDELSAVLRQVAAGFAPLDLRAVGMGCFPSPRSPRVLWVGVDEQTATLMRVQQAVENAVLHFTREPPEKRFTGHITFARVRAMTPRDSTILKDQLARFQKVEFGAWTAPGIELMRSQLSPKGAIHSVLSFAAFGDSQL